MDASFRSPDTANASRCRSFPTNFLPCRYYRSEIRRDRSSKRVAGGHSSCTGRSVFLFLFFCLFEIPSWII